MRILVGTFEICRQLYDIADGLRRLGHEVDTVAVNNNPFYDDLTYDYLINQKLLYQQLANLVKEPIQTLIDLPEDLLGLRRFLTGYDVYIFQFGWSLLPNNRDFPILKQQGKKIISIFNGSDIRHWSAAAPIAASYGYQLPDLCWEQPYTDLNARLIALRMAERFSDAIFSLPFQSELAVRPYWHYYLLANLDLYTHHIPANDVPVVVHAPSRRRFKGTDQFLAVLDQLRNEGIDFELKLLEGVPNQQVLQELSQADVVLDELHSPHWAQLAAEGMASGCVVVAGCHRDYVPLQKDSPVYHVTAETLYERLKLLLTDKAVRLEYAQRGRPHIEEHYDHTKAAARLLSKLERNGEPFDYYPAYFARAYAYPEEPKVLKNLKRLTAEIIQRHGLPEGAQPEDLIARGLIEPEELSPEKPVLHWRPGASFGVKEQIWGWSPRADQVPGEEPFDPIGEKAYDVKDLVGQALEALDNDNVASAGAILQQCIDEGQRNPAIFAYYEVLTALGRLALELDQAETALALYQQALTFDPANRAIEQAIEALTTKVAA